MVLLDETRPALSLVPDLRHDMLADTGVPADMLPSPAEVWVAVAVYLTTEIANPAHPAVSSITGGRMGIFAAVQNRVSERLAATVLAVCATETDATAAVERDRGERAGTADYTVTKHEVR